MTANRFYTAKGPQVPGGTVSYKVGIIVADCEAVVFKMAGNHIAEEYDLE